MIHKYVLIYLIMLNKSVYRTTLYTAILDAEKWFEMTIVDCLLIGVLPVSQWAFYTNVTVD